MDFYPLTQNVLCLDEFTEYPDYLKNVNDFEIIFFNRWGEIIGKSTERNGFMQDALFNYRPASDFERVVYMIKYETKEGEKREFYNYVVISAICNCG
ncbi:MAG: hypothetical protein H6599_10970 [Flavobacteriales bacterium]|nr:hypothetical protein [Flavobacteriales bacterium]